MTRPSLSLFHQRSNESELLEQLRRKWERDEREINVPVHSPGFGSTALQAIGGQPPDPILSPGLAERMLRWLVGLPGRLGVAR